ncbi:hypothetical protein BO78DRAFT_107171 [Aspergillus sclerotiicarbonarius CBS 121057]|uniref:Uncharacterized protein n=1 Tax=Aspergillus sclerotiicarbonarius (strain CBS 121057 / IBT 28362) TaxID=1448318 RepID=A0A319EJN9_ASPSB|nr:hypothetical protein BO78DRAFT_107171 [Aspergillus sclerotiicarbonarius CBS 121057]
MQLIMPSPLVISSTQYSVSQNSYNVHSKSVPPNATSSSGVILRPPSQPFHDDCSYMAHTVDHALLAVHAVHPPVSLYSVHWHPTCHVEHADRSELAIQAEPHTNGYLHSISSSSTPPDRCLDSSFNNRLQQAVVPTQQFPERSSSTAWANPPLVTPTVSARWVRRTLLRQRGGRVPHYYSQSLNLRSPDSRWKRSTSLHQSSFSHEESGGRDASVEFTLADFFFPFLFFGPAGWSASPFNQACEALNQGSQSDLSPVLLYLCN